MDVCEYLDSSHFHRLLDLALEEDIGIGDITSCTLIPKDRVAKAEIVACDQYLYAGGVVAESVFRRVDPELRINRCKEDGQTVFKGEVALTLEGSARSLLLAERTALNFLQRLVGIASLTSVFVKKAAPHGVAVRDTRKTTPGFRWLEKYAVRCGGGVNHRMGLYDSILIKDNHLSIKSEGQRLDLVRPVHEARAKYTNIEVEIEVDTLDDLPFVLESNPDWVLLDNMRPSKLREGVRICQDRCKVEASGGITLEQLGEIVETGIDAVSVGMLTHSAPTADFSLAFR